MANRNTGFSYKDYTQSDAVKKKQLALDQHLAGKIGNFAYQDYKESDAVNLALEKLKNHEAIKPGPFQYDKQPGWNNVMDQILNRKDFSYDMNSDMLYQQYKDSYMRQGKLAMQDTMGQAAALTGGYGNSYATTAGQQTYNGYMQQLNDKIPQLYQLALDKYNQETSDLYNKYGLYQSDYDTKYGKYRDDVSDYNTERDYLTGRYDTERQYDYSKYTDARDFAYGQHRDQVADWQADRDYLAGDLNNERTFDYNQYSDAYNRAYTDHTNAVSNAQWQQEFNAAQQKYNDEMKLAAAKAAGEDEPFKPFTFSHVDEDGLYHFYRDGKEYKQAQGVNPYTGTKNPDAKNGTFSNGYQPNNVGGNKLEPTNLTTDEINGVNQNIWMTTDKYGLPVSYFVWDGTKNKYQEIENPSGVRAGQTFLSLNIDPTETAAWEYMKKNKK